MVKKSKRELHEPLPKEQLQKMTPYEIENYFNKNKILWTVEEIIQWAMGFSKGVALAMPSLEYQERKSKEFIDADAATKAIDNLECLRKDASWAMGCIDGHECWICAAKRQLRKELGLSEEGK